MRDFIFGDGIEKKKKEEKVSNIVMFADVDCLNVRHVETGAPSFCPFLLSFCLPFFFFFLRFRLNIIRHAVVLTTRASPSAVVSISVVGKKIKDKER